MTRKSAQRDQPLERTSGATGSPVRLVFYEAKLFSNPELRARDPKPKVVDQLHAYRDYVPERGRKEQVINAYHSSRRVLNEIAPMRGIAPGDLIRAVAEGAHLDRDPMKAGHLQPQCFERRQELIGHRFPPKVIQHVVWLYSRFTLS